MRAASVGQQCVECIKQASQGARPARTVFGGRPAGTGLAGPWAGAIVTYSLIAINVGLFIIELARPSLATDWGLLGYAYYGGGLHGVAAGEWYRLITSAFLPPAVTGAGSVGSLGLMDILFNMWALVLVGPPLERLLGSLRFLSVYLVSALGGSVMYYYVAAPNAMALGASGAIFGLFGAWFVVSKRLRVDARGITALIVINLVISFVWRNTIAWQAHLGGLLAGALITAAYAYAPGKNRGLIQLAATAIMVALIVVAVVTRTHQLTTG